MTTVSNFGALFFDIVPLRRYNLPMFIGRNLMIEKK